MLFLTGAGAYNLLLRDGELGPMQAPFPVPRLGVGAAFYASNGSGLQPSTVLFFGQGPGLIAGVVQVNVRVPESGVSGQAGLVVYVGNYSASGQISVR